MAPGVGLASVLLVVAVLAAVLALGNTIRHHVFLGGAFHTVSRSRIVLLVGFVVAAVQQALVLAASWQRSGTREQLVSGIHQVTWCVPICDLTGTWLAALKASSHPSVNRLTRRAALSPCVATLIALLWVLNAVPDARVPPAARTAAVVLAVFLACVFTQVGVPGMLAMLGAHEGAMRQRLRRKLFVYHKLQPVLLLAYGSAIVVATRAASESLVILAWGLADAALLAGLLLVFMMLPSKDSSVKYGKPYRPPAGTATRRKPAHARYLDARPAAARDDGTGDSASRDSMHSSVSNNSASARFASLDQLEHAS